MSMPPRDPQLFMWVIYERPSDFPEHFVVRRWWTDRGKVYANPTCQFFDTLEEARASLPRNLFCMARSAGDQPQIKEVWI